MSLDFPFSSEPREMHKFAPCPFCGEVYNIGFGYEGQPAVRVFMVCITCRAQGPSKDYFTGMTFDVDAMWTRRAQEKDT